MCHLQHEINLLLPNYMLPKVRFLVSDNGFSQIFCNCLNVDEIFSWPNWAFSLSQNVQQKL